MTDKLIALAECCEAVARPDKDLDAHIMRAVGRGGLKADYQPTPLTGSIDAALTLVPEGWRLTSYGWSHTSEPHRATVHCRYGSKQGKGWTFALAICAAALRARAEQ